jgi:transcriptional regulator with XRE-family HTH domain
MQSLHIENILRLLSLSPVHTSRPRRPLPRHWKSNQKFCLQPQTLGEQLRKHRLELLWLQTDVAAKLGISTASVSDWERGITSPSHRMTKRIQEFLDHTPKVLVRKERRPNSYCSPSQLRRAAQVKEQIAQLQNELIKLSGTVLTKTVTLVKSARKKMSAAGREKIRAAQKARWAKIKRTKTTAAPGKKIKRKMSAAAKAKISAAAKVRWAKIKAAKK